LVEVAARRLKIILLAPVRVFGFAGVIRMKLVVFAQTPPPLHGQSYMVELMVEGFRARDYGIEIFHVNAQLAKTATDIGRFRFGKIFRLFGHCLKAIWIRFRHGGRHLYYVPAPPVKNPVYRDWIVMLLLRPFFSVILHWHAAGLGEWIEKQPKWKQSLTRLAIGQAHLSIPLGRFNEQDAAVFRPRQSVMVGNGIPDPCPNFPEIQAANRARLQQRLLAWNTPDAFRHKPPVSIRVLYISLCSREKGLFDAMDGVCQANRICREDHLPMEFELSIAGAFPDAATEEFFLKTLDRLGNPKTIRHVGFATGEAKTKLLAESDILLFPTFYYAESFGLVILEAMAFGMPILATRWRSVPDLFPENYPGLVNIQAPDEIAAALFHLALRDDSEAFRRTFVDNYSVERFLEKLAAAIKSIDTEATAATYTQSEESPTSAPPPAP
jgi:glycosyltransferase involved in cell wall biosynthesis